MKHPAEKNETERLIAEVETYPMHILRADLTHLNDIVRLNRVVQDLHAAQEPQCFRPFDAAAVTHFLQQALQEPSVIVLLAVDGEKPMGYVLLRMHDRPGNAYALPRKFIDLEQIAVDPDARKRGVGTALIDESFAAAKSLGYTDVELSVWHFNEEAQRFFRRMGFAPCQQRMRTRVLR